MCGWHWFSFRGVGVVVVAHVCGLPLWCGVVLRRSCRDSVVLLMGCGGVVGLFGVLLWLSLLWRWCTAGAASVCDWGALGGLFACYWCVAWCRIVAAVLFCRCGVVLLLWASLCESV